MTYRIITVDELRANLIMAAIRQSDAEAKFSCLLIAQGEKENLDELENFAKDSANLILDASALSRPLIDAIKGRFSGKVIPEIAVLS